MTRFVWGVAGVAILVWSGVAWLGHGLVGWIAAFASSNADQLTLGPDLAGLLAWLAGVLGAAGGIVIVLVWLAGCVAIAVVAAVLSRLLGRRSNLHTPGYRLPYNRR